MVDRRDQVTIFVATVDSIVDPKQNQTSFFLPCSMVWLPLQPLQMSIDVASDFCANAKTTMQNDRHAYKPITLSSHMHNLRGINQSQ